MEQWLKDTYWGNTVQAYLIALGIVIAGFLVLRIIRTIALKRLHDFSEKTATDLDDFIVKLLKRAILPLGYAGLLYFALRSLTLNEKFSATLHVAMVVVFVFFAVRCLVSVIEYILRVYLRRSGKLETNNALRGLMIIIRVLFFTFGLVFLLDNLGYNVATVLTGLGIGGIAIALAAQTILGDLFAYFSILFDRPFEIGDFLIVEDNLGTVEHIGIKTTRIASLSGEQLIYSNKNLTETWIHNYSRMKKRRAVFGFNVSYNTPPDTLEAIPGIVKEIITSQPNVAFDRAHFAAFRDSYLYFEAVYYSLSPDYTAYMNVQQAINLAIMRAFEKMGVSFGFPTRTVSLQEGSGPGKNPSLPQ
jgi:small-conductance mechanosensitive channel